MAARLVDLTSLKSVVFLVLVGWIGCAAAGCWQPPAAKMGQPGHPMPLPEGTAQPPVASASPAHTQKDAFDTLPKPTSYSVLDKVKCLGASTDSSIGAAQRHLEQVFGAAGVPRAVWHETRDGFVVALAPELLDEDTDGTRSKWGVDYAEPAKALTLEYVAHITLGTKSQARRIVFAVSKRPIPDNQGKDPRSLDRGGTLSAPNPTDASVWSDSHRCYCLVYRYTTTGSNPNDPATVTFDDGLRVQDHLEKAGLWSKL
jgi:hypothetical protein